MARALYHNLDIVLPGAFGQFSQPHQLAELSAVRSVCQASWTACIPEGDCDIVLIADVEDFVVVLVERILLAGHGHPGEDQRTSAGYDIHLSLAVFNLLNGLAGDAAVQRDKVHAVLRVKPDDIDKIFGGQRVEISLIVDNRVIDRDGTDHGRALRTEFPAERLRIAVAGEIHNGLRAEIDRIHDLLHFDIIVFAVPADAEVDVDFRFQHAADAVRIKAGVPVVCRDDNLSLSDQGQQLLHGAVLLLCHDLHLIRHDPEARRLHLRGPFLLLFLFHVSLTFLPFSDQAFLACLTL